MSGIPEGVSTVTGEGPDVRAAVIDAAGQLGVDPRGVGYQLDLAYFRSAGGGSVSRNSVRVIAWSRGEPEEPAAEEKPARKERPPRAPKRVEEAADEAEAETETEAPVEAEAPAAKPARKPRPSRAKKPPVEAAEEAEVAEAPARAAAPVQEKGEKTEAAAFAEQWFRELLGHMDLTGEVTATGTSDRVRLEVSADKNGRIIGRRGATLASIRHLLKLALQKWGDFVIDVDIPDGRDEDGDGEDRRARRDDRGGRDRDDRGGRDRGGRDRGPRGRDRDRGPRSDRPRGEYPEEKLQAIAQRASEKALESGRPVTINLPLNSHDRRIVHVTVSELDGVDSNSVMKGDVKYVQVVPLFSVDED